MKMSVAKRRRTTTHPQLPNDVLLKCLEFIAYSELDTLSAVCVQWRQCVQTWKHDIHCPSCVAVSFHFASKELSWLRPTKTLIVPIHSLSPTENKILFNCPEQRHHECGIQNINGSSYLNLDSWTEDERTRSMIKFYNRNTAHRIKFPFTVVLQVDVVFRDVLPIKTLRH